MGLTIIEKAPVLRRFLTYDMEWVPGAALYTPPTADGKYTTAGKKTAPLQHRVTGVFDGAEHRKYPTVDAFLKGELTSDNRGMWFYAHAGGLADMGFVLDRIISMIDGDDAYSVDASFSGSSAIIVHVRRGKNVWHFIDSYWLLRDSLASIGRYIGVEKGDAADAAAWIRFRFGKPEFAALDKLERKAFYTEAPDAVLNAYLTVDCEILYKAISQFETLLLDLGGQLQMTIASCAMQLFRRRYLSENIPTDAGLNARAARAYYSSRVEPYQRAMTRPGRRYDINSSFPFAMTFPAPGRVLGPIRDLPLGSGRLFMADVDVEVPECYLPPLPYRAEGRVFFPWGKWAGTYMNTDLELLEEEGGKVTKVREVIEFAPNYDLAEYAADLYKRRDAAEYDSFEKIGYKYLGNSCYGKFGESPYKSQIVINPAVIDLVGDPDKGIGPMVQYMPGVWKKDICAPVAHAHVPIAAHITAVARRTLFRAQRQCETLYYSDTDSIDTGANLASGRALGDFKLEAALTAAYYVGPKLYEYSAYWCYRHGAPDLARPDQRRKGKSALGPFCASCGAPADIKTVHRAKGFSEMDDIKFELLLAGKAIPYQRMARLRELYDAKGTAPIEVLVEKAVRGLTRPKRYFYPDGHTRPWHVLELSDKAQEPSFETKRFSKAIPEDEPDPEDLPF